MNIKYNVPSKKRKEMAQVIAKWLEVEIKYLGAPTFAYEIDYFTIDKDGNLIFDDMADSEVIERLLQHLYNEGFESDLSVETTRLSLSVGREDYSETDIENLKKLIENKAELFKTAFDTDSLKINITEDDIEFPWFPFYVTPDEMDSYSDFLMKLCEMVKSQKRINNSEKKVENTKYTFRCFLLRLGFIGDEYKTARKILLKNFTGSSAFKGGSDNVSK